MTKIVIDTNVLVSALLSPNGSPAKILAYVFNGQATACYDSRMMMEAESPPIIRRCRFTAL